MNIPLELTHCIQCKDLATGETGCFVHPVGDFHAISPVFDDLGDLYMWMRGKYVLSEYVSNEFKPGRVIPIGDCK